eukprot:COSAG05_NODE_587_length_8516_cov_10.000356_3_plen_228_part_00
MLHRAAPILAALAACLAPSAAAVSPPSEAVVTVAGLRYRVQALSESVIRLEAEAARGGFEDRPTFFARNRSWAGAPVTSQAHGANSTIVATGSWSLELSAAAAPGSTDELTTFTGAAAAATVSTCANPLSGFTLAGAPALPGTAASAAAQDGGMCCAACDAATGCAAWSYTPPPPPPAPPGPGPKPQHGLRAAPCKSGEPGQQWALQPGKGTPAGWANVVSGASCCN